MKRAKGNISNFYCTCCGNKGIPIFRQVGKEREGGHLKKLFCPWCGEKKNMVEVKPNGKYGYNDFKIEFIGGNFQEGERKIPYKQFISNYYKNGVIL